MDRIGEYLKEVRMTRGLTYSDVELATRIPARYLEAIEEGNFDQIPGKAYVIGFIRSYAKFLQVDSDELISYYKEISGINEEHPLPSPGQTDVNDKDALAKANHQPMKKWKVGIIVSFLVVLSLAAVLYYLGAMNNSNSPINDPSDLVPTDNNQGTPDVSQPDNGQIVIPPVTNDPIDSDDDANDEEPVIMEGLNILLSAKRGPCWISVTYSDRKEEHYLNRGDEITLKDSSYIKIKFGSAGAVDVYVNDVLQDSLGEIGDVLIKEYSKE